jgi:hypothetical protein
MVDFIKFIANVFFERNCIYFLGTGKKKKEKNIHLDAYKTRGKQMKWYNVPLINII